MNFVKPKYRELIQPIVDSYGVEIETTILEAKRPVYPDQKNIFKAFEHHDLDELRVVILGQDPYHTKDIATGLCFGVGKQGY